MPFKYKNYLLNLLMAIMACNLADRLALGIVLQDIKTDLNLTDTQLGLLTGIAFALFYSVMGIPIARWADKGNRVTIIALTTALWSAAMALCGMATSFIQLLLVRIGVAVGEAGCMPSAHSLISDHFTRAERPRAISFHLLGGPLGAGVGYLAAGWLNEIYGWRETFVILGLPGLFLAALALFTLKEPRRMKAVTVLERCAHLQAERAPSTTPSLKEVGRTLWGNATFRHLLLGFSAWSFFGNGILQWTPAFFMRSHGLATGELGNWFALIHGVGGVLGIYLGGELASRYAAGNERLQLMACAGAFGFFALLAACAYLAPHHHLAFAALAVASFGGSMAHGPMLATIQTLVPARMRAMAIATLLLFANLIGMGLGPLAVGVLSDSLRPWLGEESLRYALVILCPGHLWAAWHLSRASRLVSRDLERVHEH